MNTKIEVFLGSPLEVESEKRFLSSLCAELKAIGRDALVFANFLLPLHKPTRQIDFLVILDQWVCQVELKELTASVVGSVNGVWSLRLPDGTEKSLHGNPYRQALECKYAISDQMHRFARRHPVAEPMNGAKFYKQFDSVVCVTPDLVGASQVPSDGRVTTLGFPALLQRLTGETRCPNWTFQNWTAFAMDIGLVRAGEFTQAPPDSDAAARDLAEAYSERFRGYYQRLVDNLVPTTVEVDNQRIKSRECLDLLTRGQHAQLIGASGSGKSMHAQAMALESLGAGRIPIFARAIDYTGRLTTLLDRSIAHLSPRTATQFIESMKRLGKPISLVIDGFNECPCRLHDKLIRDLQAAFLRWEMPVLITTQTAPSLPSNLAGRAVHFREPTDDERCSILTQYGKEEVTPAQKELCSVFRSAYELSLAAVSLMELGGSPTRSRLFESFVRRSCGNTVDYALLRPVLTEVADAMQLELQSRLPVDELWRLCEKVFEEQGAPLATINKVFEVGLLEVRQGQCVFRHELIQRYFESLALLRSAASWEDLTALLSRPANHALIEFALGMQTDPAAIRACLVAAANSKAAAPLVSECLQRKFGGRARRVALDDAKDVLSRAKEDLHRLEVSIAEGRASTGGFHLEVRHVAARSPYEHALLGAVAESLVGGLFLDDVLNLLADTEQRFVAYLERTLGAERIRKPSVRSNVFGELFVLGRACDRLSAAAIVRASNGRIHSDVAPIVIEHIRRLFSQIDLLTPAQIYLLLGFVRHGATPQEQDIPKIIRHCWRTGIYHLRLRMLDCVGYWGRRWGDHARPSEAGRAEAADALSELQTSNVMLSGQLYETLMVFDLVDSPVDAERARQEIVDIIAHPRDPRAHQAAASVVGNMFEVVFEDAYEQAIENLRAEERVTLFVMAALGVPSYSLWIVGDYVLTKLLRHENPRTLPAFERFAQELDDDTICAQGAAKCFALGHIGCAKYLDAPKALANLSTVDRRAWQCYGEILFWSNKPGLTADEVVSRCEPLWETLHSDLGFEAVDPLRRLAQSDGLDPNRRVDNPAQKLFELFGDMIRDILEYGLKHREHLSTVVTRQAPSWLPRDLTTFLIHTLGQIGNHDTTGLLTPLVDDEYHGPEAVEAIRRLNSG